jgi:hypothetical protein
MAVNGKKKRHSRRRRTEDVKGRAFADVADDSVDKADLVVADAVERVRGAGEAVEAAFFMVLTPCSFLIKRGPN